MISAFRTDDGAVTMTSLWSTPGTGARAWPTSWSPPCGTGPTPAAPSRSASGSSSATPTPRAFHESLGFAPTGAERPYEPSPDIREVELTLPLR
jgi:hypothetical protein